MENAKKRGMEGKERGGRGRKVTDQLPSEYIGTCTTARVCHSKPPRRGPEVRNTKLGTYLTKECSGLLTSSTDGNGIPAAEILLPAAEIRLTAAEIRLPAAQIRLPAAELITRLPAAGIR